jgi:hypothetical protein
MATSLGIWRAYRPAEIPASMRPPQPAADDKMFNPAIITQAFVNTLFLRNAAGDDWYEFSKALPLDRTYVLVADGEVRSASNDPTALVPKDMELFALDDFVGDINGLYFKSIEEL